MPSKHGITEENNGEIQGKSNVICNRSHPSKSIHLNQSIDALCTPRDPVPLWNTYLTLRTSRIPVVTKCTRALMALTAGGKSDKKRVKATKWDFRGLSPEGCLASLARQSCLNPTMVLLGPENLRQDSVATSSTTFNGHLDMSTSCLVSLRCLFISPKGLNCHFNL